MLLFEATQHTQVLSTHELLQTMTKVQKSWISGSILVVGKIQTAIMIMRAPTNKELKVFKLS